MIKSFTLTCLLVLSVLFVSAQEKLSGGIYAGYLVPYNDFEQTDYVGYKKNLGLGINLGYQLSPFLRLRGDVASGLINGNNAINYYETTIYEAHFGADINVIRFFNPQFEKFKLNFQGGFGMMMYAARLYNRSTSAKVVESPVRGVRTFSPNAIVVYGANVAFQITPKLDFTFGYSNRYVEDVDWMDGQKSGDYTDSYGMAQVGLLFYLKSDRDRSKIEVDTNRYRDIIAKNETLSKQVEESSAEKERMAELEMANQEKSVRIRQLESDLDSLKKQRVAKVDTARPKATPARVDAKAALANEQYRIVVASLPTQTMAQRWIDRSSLDKSQMIIAYIGDLNTYRVIYKSYDAYPAARKELLNVKPVVSDAWIVKF